MFIRDALDRVSEVDKQNYTKAEVKALLSKISPEKEFHSLEKLRLGDIFIYTVVGGKRRPWVVLWARKGLVGAISMTHSGDLPGQFQSQCRFYPTNYLGPTLTVVEEQRVLDTVVTPYSNKKHLFHIRKEIQKVWK